MSAEILIKINSKGSVVTTTVKSPRYYKPKSSDLNAVSLSRYYKPKSSDLNAVSLPAITSPRVQTSMLVVPQILQAQEFRPQCCLSPIYYKPNAEVLTTGL